MLSASMIFAHIFQNADYIMLFFFKRIWLTFMQQIFDHFHLNFIY